MAANETNPPLHPRPDRATFLPRLGHGQQALIPLLVELGVTATVVPLYYVKHNPELTLVPAGAQLGSVLDPVTQIRQKPLKARPPGFRALPFGADLEPYDPDLARLTDSDIEALAVGPIDLQRSRGATLMLTTFHVAGAVGTRGRQMELLLAELGIRHFRNERMDEPPEYAAVTVRREIFATIAVDIRDLRSPRARQALVDAYLALSPDGFWVKIDGFHERASDADVRRASTFLSGLRSSGLPVVSCGAGQLHLALLADEISASIGLAESERFKMPVEWKPASDGKPRGRTRMAYHPKLHRSFRVGSEQAARAFSEAQCSCGEHLPRIPPTGLVVARHAAKLRAAQAAEALAGDCGDRREWLLASADVASWAAADAGLPGAHTASSKYQAVFEGLDSADEIVAYEQGEL